MHRARISHTTLGFGLSSVVLLVAVFGNGCDSSASNSGGSCPAGAARCACYANDTCNDGLTCASGICVKVNGTTETGGNTGVSSTTAQGGQASESAGASAVSSSGGANPSVAGGGTSPLSNTGGALGVTGGATSELPTGGATAVTVTTGGASATVTTGGTGPTATAATGGAPIATGGAPVATGGAPVATGGAPIATGGASSANNSPIIDAFATCDDKIENNGGRSGKWYFFADTDFNATHAYGDPGTQWADHGCAAWLILGCTGTACTFAGLGLQLSEGNPYSLSSYAGLSIAFESKDNLYVTVKTSDGGNFGVWMTGGTGNVTRNVDFSNFAAMANSATTVLNKSLVTEVQFTIGKTIELDAGFGFAIHSVSLR